MHLIPENSENHDIYRVLIAAVSPRPIAWVSSHSDAGTLNLAPYSFFNVVSVNPAILAFAPITKPDGSQKDTLNNIRSTKEFVVNIVSRDQVNAMNTTSVNAPENVNEFDIAGLTPEESHLVRVPRVAEAQINFECSLHECISFGTHPGAGNLVLGKVKCINIKDRLYQNGRIDQEALNVVGRMAGNDYVGIGDKFDIERPEW
ncbi:flavin reductase family protein [Marinibactrum halimedae]|uniref:Flavin reductase n=1 Tax=Marinibactrum halimedae TaxID=1444977 RepID=A0AA37T2G6_9GAMM|nr:flavin reductase family protein [Marinibactrum halimedae]MCD9459922.1 flavin reductase family protein [Marinibactrum halimedae]GLS25223.1 flavin reductase [Marinibactrum halimedae]